MTPLLLSLTFLSLQTLDLMTTWWLVQHSGVQGEGNPLMRWVMVHWGWTATVLVKMGLSLLMLGCLRGTGKSFPEWALRLLALVTLVMGGVVLWNTYLILMFP